MESADAGPAMAPHSLAPDIGALTSQDFQNTVFCHVNIRHAKT
jgi:hypothetical protein